MAAKLLVAPRIATSGRWETEGHRSASNFLAELEGSSPGQAKRLLETGQHLSSRAGRRLPR